MGGSYGPGRPRLDPRWIWNTRSNPSATRKSGLVTGMEAVTGTFVRYLDAHPTFMHPIPPSQAAGSATSLIANGPWRDSERFLENEEMSPAYNIHLRGLYAA